MFRLEDRPQARRGVVTAASAPLIRTKLEPPRHNDELVPRLHLVERLKQGLNRPLTLVHAPAGYGKSSLVGQWLDQPDPPRATWLWLDEGDNDLQRFIAYTVAAVRRLFPDSCQYTSYLLNLPVVASPDMLVNTLLNELDDTSHPFVLVLEEYETIWRQEIHHFLSELVEHQPENLHLVLVSRVVPPLPLPRLRQRRLLNELDANDLQLTLAEAKAILAEVAPGPMDESEVESLYARSEGWVGGLHLLLASGDAGSYVDEFLLTEVLAHQPPQVQQFLLETSLLERFTPSLAASVCQVTPSPEAATTLLHALRDASLFLHVPDGSSGWYRYHSLFRGALRRLLLSRRGMGEVAALHRRAATWLESHGEIEAALSHWLAAGERQAAADLVEREVPQAIASEAFTSLASWLALLPTDLCRQRPALLLADAWVKQTMLYLPDLVAQLDLLETSLEEDDDGAPHLQGRVAALHSDIWYWRGNRARSQALAEYAQTMLPACDAFTAAYTVARTALSQQMTDAEEDALQQLAVAEHRPDLAPGGKAQLLLARALLKMSSGYLHNAEPVALSLLRLAEAHQLKASASWARYLLGRIYYEWDRLEEAAGHFRAVVEAHDGAAGLPLHDSHLGLALIHELQGDRQAADEVVADLGDRLWERGAFFVPAITSLQARLALMRGDSTRVEHELRQYRSGGDEPHLLPLEIPALTRARVLIATDTRASLRAALGTLRTLQRLSQTTHNRLRTVEIFALRALILQSRGETETALDVLRQALSVAERGEMVRTFVDLGPPMAALLYQLSVSEPGRAYARRVLAAFSRSPRPEKPATAKAEKALIEPLTDREHEVLALMGRRLSNKEIAQNLIISPYTVKKHASNIYQKLAVSGRRQAVARAHQLGLLPSSGAVMYSLSAA